MCSLMSTLKKVFILLLFSTLWACSGSSDSDKDNTNNNIQTGIFLDSAVAGLRYKTPTQSGLTNNAGEFKYKQGETVIFSVGGITLGSATGANQITPFDLLSIAPPQTEAETRSALSNHYNVSAFDQVLNIVIFLTSLDNDGNPDNGIDLSGWDDTLKNANLSFEHNKNNFPSKEFNDFVTRFGVTNVKELTFAVTHILASLNINIPVHLVATEHYDNDNDGTIDRINEYTYDDQGRQISYKSDQDNDGNFEYITHTEFNSDGFITLIKYLTDNDGIAGLDATSLETHITTYDANNNRLSNIINRDTDGDGHINTRTTRLFTYDENNNQTHKVTAEFTLDNVGNETLNRHQTETTTFDANNRPLTYSREIDHNGDLEADSIETHTKTYNSAGKLLSKIIRDDNNADGTPEGTETITFDYDDRGNALTILKEIENTNSNAGIDDKRLTIKTYDANNNLLTEVTNFYTYLSDINTPYRVTKNTRKFNSDRLLINSLFETDNNNDSTFESIQKTNLSYDEFGNLISHIYIEDADTTDDLINYKTIITSTFANSNELTYESFDDYDGDGINDTHFKITYVYDSNGNQLSALTQYDNNADGIFDSNSFKTSTYIKIESGLLGLIQQNFLY